MTTTRFYLDTRNTGKGKPAPLKIAITKKGQAAFISLNVQILPSQWDKRSGKVVGHPNRFFLNTYITSRKQAVDTLLLKLIENGELFKMRAVDIKARIISELNDNDNEESNKDTFAARFVKFADSKKERTRQLYYVTLRRLRAYAGEEFDKLRFEDVTKEWLTGFDTFMQKTAPSRNARNIHLRNIRAVFNEAIDDEVTTFYPFRRFKIRPIATAKRSLTVERLRELFSFPVEDCQRQYLDMFKLIFFLIGINTIDLCNLKQVKEGRIEYYRSKTNRLYSVKVEPEAMDIINRYRGENHLLGILDRYKNYKDYAKRLNNNLQHIGHTIVGKHGKKEVEPLFPNLTTYWARHSWATIAAELEIPKETIAAALGHGGNTVTDIYIDFDRRKVDDANRRVLDWVLYGKRQ